MNLMTARNSQILEIRIFFVQNVTRAFLIRELMIIGMETCAIFVGHLFQVVAFPLTIKTQVFLRGAGHGR
jgi:hypothetical protein